MSTKLAAKLHQISNGKMTPICLVVAFAFIGSLLIAVVWNSQQIQAINVKVKNESLFTERLNNIEQVMLQLRGQLIGHTELKIGVLFPQTGDASYIGIPMRAALLDAFRQIKIAYPSLQLSFEFRDTASDEAVAWLAFQELYDQGFRVFIGPATSNVMLTVAKAAPEDAVFLSPTATATELRYLTNTLMMCPDNLRLANVLLQRLQRFKIRQIIMVHRNDVYGNSMRQAIETINKLTQQPVEIFQIPYNTGIDDFGKPFIVNKEDLRLRMAHQVEIIQTRQEGNYTAVVTVSRAEIERLLELGTEIPFINEAMWLTTDSVSLGADRLINSVKARQFARSVFLTGFAFAGDQFTAYKRIKEIDSLRELLGTTPALHSVLAYDTVNLLVSAYKTYGQLSTRQLFSRLRHDEFLFNGLSGSIKFNENGFRSDGSYAIMSYMPDVASVNLLTDGDWVLQAFHRIKDDTEVGSADQLKKRSIEESLIENGLHCNNVGVQISSKDAFSHKTLAHNYTLATMPDLIIIQATFGWYMTISCQFEQTRREHRLDITCGPIEMNGQRECWTRLEGTNASRPMSLASGFRRRLLQSNDNKATVSSVKLVCAAISPMCLSIHAMMSASTLLPADNRRLVDIILKGICDFADLGCDVSFKLEAENLIKSGGSVICTELYRQGRLSVNRYYADHEFGRQLEHTHPEAIRGYQLLATPIVGLMRNNEYISDIFEVIATPWAEEMAYQMGETPESNPIGLLMLKIGVPFFTLIDLAYTNSGFLTAMALFLFVGKHFIFSSKK